MQRSGSQKVLLVLSILALIGAAFYLLGGIAGFFAGGVVTGMDASQAADLTAETGASQGMLAAVMSTIGAVGILGAIASLIEGILGIRAANDNTKIMPVYYLACAGLILAVIGLVMTFTGGNANPSTIGSGIGDIVGDGLMFWIANNIKNQAGL